MDIYSLVPTKIRRRFCGSLTRRRTLMFTSLIAMAFVILYHRPIFHSANDKPQMNDRKILESDNLVVVPRIIDSAMTIDKASEERQHPLDIGHPKHIISFSSNDIKQMNEESIKEAMPTGSAISDVKEQSETTVVLVICAVRPAAIENHLQQLIRLRPSAERFPIVVSQDGTHNGVTSSVQKFVNESAHISFIQHSERTGRDSAAAKTAKNYFYIAQHYKWALDKIFFEMNYNTAIITEDDLDIAEDFFSYFSATRYLLRSDPSIWCISAWNDNGGNNITDRSRSETLYRTDFFPGLGWMLTRDLWQELSPNWPLFYWDDWLRRQDIRRNRVCIRPEVSRTAHNNKVAGKGTSGGLYKTYLASIHLPETPIDFSLLDLSYLTKGNYDRLIEKRINEAKEISIETIESFSLPSAENSYLVVYNTPKEYRRIARAIGLMIDIRSGMPRTAYYGIVPFILGTSRVYAVPGSLKSEKHFTSKATSYYYNEDWDKMNRYLDFKETFCRQGKFTGVCDPKNPELIEWFKQKRSLKRLQSWGDMIVN